MRKILAVVAMLLLHLLLYSGMASFFLRQSHPARLGATMLPFLLFAGVGAVIFPPMARLFRRARQEPLSLHSCLRMAPVAATAVAFLLTFLPGYDAWLRNPIQRYAADFAMAMLAPAAYHVFYNFSPPRHRGVWFGAGLALGFALWRLLLHAAAVAVHPVWPHPELIPVFVAQIALAAALAAVLLCCFFLPSPEAPASGDASPASGGKKPRRAVVYLFAAAGCVYMTNALADVRLFPLLVNASPTPVEPLQVLAVLFCPLVGWYVDRNPPLGFRRIAIGTASVFVLTPTLASLGDAPGLYLLVYALTTVAQLAFFVVVTDVLAKLAGPGDGVCRIPVLLSAWRFFSVVGFLQVRAAFEMSTGASVFLATVMAVAYYAAVRRVDADLGESTTPSPVEAVGGAGQSKPASPHEERQRIFNQYCLSPREREVAEEWLKGASNRDIAVLLGISENTVKTHVKNILSKTKMSNRTDFLVRMLGGREDGAAPGKDS